MARPKVDSRLQNIEQGILEIKEKLDKFPNLPRHPNNAKELDDDD